MYAQLTGLAEPLDPSHDPQPPMLAPLNCRSMLPLSYTLFRVASVAQLAESARQESSSLSEDRTSRVAWKTASTLVRLRTFRASAYAIRSRLRILKPLVRRRSNCLNAGRRTELTWLSTCEPAQALPPKPSDAVSPSFPFSAVGHGVYGVPDAYRAVAFRPTFCRMVPSIVPWFQPS